MHNSVLKPLNSKQQTAVIKVIKINSMLKLKWQQNGNLKLKQIKKMC